MSQEMSPLGVRAQEALKGFAIKDNAEAAIVTMIKDMVPESEVELREKLSQQTVNNILNGRVERSFYTPFLADILGVRCVWLAFGVGPKTPKSDTMTARDARVLKMFQATDEPVKRAIEKALATDGTPKNKKSKQPASTKKTVLRPVA